MWSELCGAGAEHKTISEFKLMQTQQCTQHNKLNSKNNHNDMKTGHLCIVLQQTRPGLALGKRLGLEKEIAT